MDQRIDSLAYVVLMCNIVLAQIVHSCQQYSLESVYNNAELLITENNVGSASFYQYYVSSLKYISVRARIKVRIGLRYLP